jgi:hypothetical protein
MVTTETTAPDRKRKWNPLLVVVLVGAFSLMIVVALGGLFIFVSRNQRVNRSKADESLKTLEREYTLIAPLPSASRLRYESSHKISLGSVSADYRTDKSYAQIRAHYDNELKKNGWTYVGEKPVKIWWQDYGGKEAFYCKDHYTATLQYAGGSEEQFGSTFNFNLSWGLRDECN